MAIFICSNCGNSDPTYIGIKNGEYYCRRCILMKEETVIRHKNYPPVFVQPNINYGLTAEQDRIAKQVVKNYRNFKNTLIYAVCGAGKTELVFDVMKEAISKGHTIGFTIPRKEVVIEIYERLKSAFPTISICAVYGGNTTLLEAQIIVLTTHQLYRYKAYFDLLIFDEIDAFPYAGDFVLEAMFYKAVKGNYVVMSATPSKALIETFENNGEVLTLFSRFHNQAIPVPRLIRSAFFSEYVVLILNLKRMLKNGKSVLVFVPTISEAEILFPFLKVLIKGGEIVHSKMKNNSETIKKFKTGEYRYLVTTTVLERGITIKGLQVIVLHADHKLFETATLIQIAGRVGRKKDEPFGEVIFIAKKKTKNIVEAIEDINDKNAYLQDVLKKRIKSDIK